MPGFNSNMVRLKVGEKNADSRVVKSFQFQYGAIKSVIVVLKPSSIPCFNSNMVRLKVIITVDGLIMPPPFQFQYGAIKRSK